jgi:hypothetical protein
MARESAAITSIIDELGKMEGVKVYDQVQIDKWNTYNFNYVGVLSGADTRENELFEDDSAYANRGSLEIYLLVGVQVKKSNTQKAVLRNALADLCEKVEYMLQNHGIESYITDYESTEFAPVHFVDSQAVTFSDDETKGVAFMTFRTLYYRN